MKVVSLKEIVRIAKHMHRQGKKWHFHLLLPSCTFNHQKGKHSFILEDEKQNKTYVSHTNHRPMREGKELAHLLHKHQLTMKKKNIITNAKVKIIIQRASKYNAQRIPWHHHLLFPNCIYNHRKGSWCLVFEDPITGKTISSRSKKEPHEYLRALEEIYYLQKK